MSTPQDGVWYLHVKQERLGSIAVLTAAGRVSSLTFRDLESALVSAADSSATAVVLDLSQVDYVSSPGLRAVAGASTRLTGEGRAFVVCGLTDAVNVAFALGGLEGTVATESSREAAFAALSRPAPPRLDTSPRDV